MIAEIHSLEEYKYFIDEISADPEHSDPHFSYSSDNLFDFLQDGSQKAFVSSNGETITGLFVWLVLADEKYMEMTVGLTKEKAAFLEMLSYIEKHYLGYKADFVVNPRNKAICDTLKNKSAVFDKEQQRMTWVCDKGFGSFVHVEVLSPKWEDAYCTLHQKDTYWTAERIIGSPDKFRSFVAIKDQHVIGYLDVTHCYDENEIYDLFVIPNVDGVEYKAALLSKTLKLNKPKKMTALVDTDAEEDIAAYTSVGFEKIENQNCVYVSYHTPL